MGSRGPKPAGAVARSKRVPVSMMPEVYERFKAAADDAGVSVSTWLRDAGAARLANTTNPRGTP